MALPTNGSKVRTRIDDDRELDFKARDDSEAMKPPTLESADGARASSSESALEHLHRIISCLSAHRCKAGDRSSTAQAFRPDRKQTTARDPTCPPSQLCHRAPHVTAGGGVAEVETQRKGTKFWQLWAEVQERSVF